MAVTIANILVGAGNIDQWDGAAFANLGATIDGVEVAFEPDVGEVEIDQLKDAAILFVQKVNVTMRTNLAEATLKNLALAWGYPETAVSTSGSVTTFNLADPDEDLVERRLRVRGKAPSGGSRVYEVRRAVSVEGSTHGLKKGEATVFPVAFRLLADPVYSGSEYGTIVDTI